LFSFHIENRQKFFFFQTHLHFLLLLLVRPYSIILFFHHLSKAVTKFELLLRLFTFIKKNSEKAFIEKIILLKVLRFYHLLGITVQVCCIIIKMKLINIDKSNTLVIISQKYIINKIQMFFIGLILLPLCSTLIFSKFLLVFFYSDSSM
jgi:hypothetical protein